MNRILIPLILLVLIFAGAGYYFLNHQNKVLPQPLPEGGVCDSETMTCSDGTVLKKQWPNCDFPPCPSSSNYPQGEQITISGTMICLPHKNSSGPQTMECAFGLQGRDGNNYGLSDANWKYLIGVGNGTEVEIKGQLTEKEDQKYNSIGTIEIQSLVKKSSGN